MIISLFLYTSIFMGIGENYIISGRGHTFYTGWTDTKVELGIGTGYIFHINEEDEYYKMRGCISLRRYFKKSFFNFYPYLEYGVDFIYRNREEDEIHSKYSVFLTVSSMAFGVRYDFVRDKLWSYAGIKLLSDLSYNYSATVVLNIGLRYKL